MLRCLGLKKSKKGVPFTRVDKDNSLKKYDKLKEQFPDSDTDKRIRRENNFQKEGWDSENLPIQNAIYLNKEIHRLFRLHKKPIIIISHSKGGLDTLATLITYPDLTEKENPPIAGWISIQAPFEGTPIAEMGELKIIQGPLVWPFNGDAKSLSDMRANVRCKKIGTAGARIENIGKQITVLSFASWEDGATTLAVPRDGIKKLAGVNDGLVPVNSAILKNASGNPIDHFIKTGGFDHAVPVMPASMFRNLTIFGEKEKKGFRNKLTQVLVKIWLEKVNSNN